MANFVLVHGGMHGGWCWEKVVPRLKAAGHSAIAPDLPAMAPNDPVAAKDVTLAMLGEFVANIVRSQPEPVVLVAHSMGGIAISEAAERVPERMMGLVYLSAALMSPGETMFGPFQQWRLDNPAELVASTLSEDGTVLLANKASAPRIFYNTCDPEDVERALARVMPQPLKPGIEPSTVTPQRFGLVPRAYIECIQDNGFPLGFQRLMQRNWPCDPVFTMDNDHSPFYSAPDQLVDHLISAADAFARK